MLGTLFFDTKRIEVKVDDEMTDEGKEGEGVGQMAVFFWCDQFSVKSVISGDGMYYGEFLIWVLWLWPWKPSMQN